jgi:hypothetical protein
MGYPPQRALPPQGPAGYPPQGQMGYPPQPVPPAYAPPAPGAYPGYPPSPPRKRRSGFFCLGCVGVVLAGVLLVAGVVAWLWFSPPKSRNLTTGRRQTVASTTVPSSGGTVQVQAPGSEVDGLAIHIPAGAYQGDSRFTISTRPIEEHKFGELVNPVTPLITIDNGHEFAQEPMTVEIPIRLQPGQFAMAFFYDSRTGKLEGIPLVALEQNKVTVLTSHFSDLLVSVVDLIRLQRVPGVDTGFVPGVDDWQFTNRGSIVATSGHCAGQSVAAMWYYTERKLGAGDPPLYGRFDDNDKKKTADFEWDDSWGWRMSSVVQNQIDWDNANAKLLRGLGDLSDGLTWNAFTYAMLVTGEPQFVYIRGTRTEANGTVKSVGHAIVAYKIAEDRLYVADPNKPGMTARWIRLKDEKFEPYSSGSNAEEIAAIGETSYTVVRYLAKSAIFDWAQIGTEYQNMLKGKAGEGVFPAYAISMLTDVDPTTGEKVWAPVGDVLEISEEQTAKPGEEYRGKLVLRIEPGQAGKYYVYQGTKPVVDGALAAGGTEFTLPIKPGIYDLGVLTMYTVPGTQKDKYNDCRRIQVVYGKVDLTGSWEGTWRFQEADKARQYIEEILARIILTLGLAETDQQAREIAAGAVEESATLRQERPMGVILEPASPETPDRYRARVFLVGDDGVQAEYAGTAVYEKGRVEFSVSVEASRIDFSGELTGSDDLSGTFTLSAWGVVKDAASGVWELARNP